MSFQKGVVIVNAMTHIYQQFIKNQISLQKNQKISKLSLCKEKKINPPIFGKTSSFIKGSMTVEASIATTLFVLFFAAFLQLFSLALHETTLVSMTHNIVTKQSQLSFMPLGEGVSYLELNANYPLGMKPHIEQVGMDSDYIDLRVSIQEESYFPFFKSFWKLGARGIARKWTGKKRSLSKEEASQEVYVTAYGKVYHKDLHCTYLNPSIRSISKDQLSVRRNENGSKYKKCPYCSKGNTSLVYITSWGDAYHSSPNCSRLKRTIEVTTLDQTNIGVPCSKCGGRHD